MMVDGSTMRFLEGIFYLVVGGSACYGLWDFSRRQRRTRLTVIKTNITAYKLLKMVEGRSR